ncbi:MAG TPA: DUF2341 domain-containing protein, partial [Bacteroidia bacterium]|nr:DUF2341 domain-containing protein [Bacteroidia bacterium]
MNKLRFSFFSFFTLLSLAGFAAPPGYSYYKLCTTQESQITVGVTTLNNFPVLVRITDNDLRSTANGGYVQNVNGFDIIYTAADGNTVIPFQLESYNAVTGSVVAWVKVPVVSSTVNSNFYMYFGNSSVVTNQSSTATWDANYKAVYHLHANENDGTANAFNLVNSGTTNLVGAVAADGQHFVPAQFLRYSA